MGSQDIRPPSPFLTTLAEDEGFDPRGVAPNRFPSVRPRPLNESSVMKSTGRETVSRWHQDSIGTVGTDPPCGVTPS